MLDVVKRCVLEGKELVKGADKNVSLFFYLAANGELMVMNGEERTGAFNSVLFDYRSVSNNAASAGEGAIEKITSVVYIYNHRIDGVEPTRKDIKTYRDLEILFKEQGLELIDGVILSPNSDYAYSLQTRRRERI